MNSSERKNATVPRPLSRKEIGKKMAWAHYERIASAKGIEFNLVMLALKQLEELETAKR